MKYYIGKIEERNGDFEYSESYLFKIKTEGDPQKFAEETAMEWRGSSDDDWDEEQDGWWCDCTLVFNGGYREISEEDFNVLSNYIAVL